MIFFVDESRFGQVNHDFTKVLLHHGKLTDLAKHSLMEPDCLQQWPIKLAIFKGLVSLTHESTAGPLAFLLHCRVNST